MTNIPSPVSGIADLTAEWFTSSLRVNGIITPATEVSSAKPQLFGTGQFGLVARAELSYSRPERDAPSSVIVKLPSEDPGSRGLAAAIGAYEAEVRFYQEIAPLLSARTPQLFWGGYDPTTSGVTLVLEDLSADWQSGDAVAGGNLPQSEAAIDELVRIQSELWDSSWLQGLTWLAPIQRTQALFDVVPTALSAFMQRFADHLQKRHLRVIERLVPHASQYPALAWRGPMVVTHGDFRLDNVLFQNHGAMMRATVIDWQAVRVGPPLIDVAIWMASSLSVDERRKHHDSILRRYHNGLLAKGVKDFTFGQCSESLRVCSLYVLLLCVGTSVALKQSDRGDTMFAAMVAAAADLVCDVRAENIFNEE